MRRLGIVAQPGPGQAAWGGGTVCALGSESPELLPLPLLFLSE